MVTSDRGRRQADGMEGVRLVTGMIRPCGYRARIELGAKFD